MFQNQLFIMKGNVIISFSVLFVVLLFFGCDEPTPPIDTGPTGGNANCPSALQVCGNGCIPNNALCCDDGAVNSYCLQPTTGCGEGTCNTCPEGQAFCGMFCKPIGEECCIGGVCPEKGTITNPDEPEITLDSVSDVICTFQKTESLWSPDMPWDGSYVCRGSVTLDFHGLEFSSSKTLNLYIENNSSDSTGNNFDEFYAQAGTPINQVTFHYASIGGDYFQKNQPPCPAPSLEGLRLVEKIPDVEDPFPTQTFDVTISSECQ